MSSAVRRPIALVGLMGAGKTTVARRIGERLGVDVLDLDDDIERDTGLTVRRYFEERGETAFRAHEREALRRAIEGGAGVIACGGGIVLDAEARTRLRDECRTVWLEVAAETAAARLLTEAVPRPMLDGAPPLSRLETLLAERAGRYAEVASVRIATDGLDPDAVAASVLAALGLDAPGAVRKS
jgi:shikimate kinase